MIIDEHPGNRSSSPPSPTESGVIAPQHVGDDSGLTVADGGSMTDPRISAALRHLPLDAPPPNGLVWSVVSPDPTGRVQLPAAVADLLGTGPARARVIDGVLVLGELEGPGPCIGIDRRGRLYLPVWLRRPALVVVADAGRGVVVLADVAVLDAVGERLLQGVRT